MYRIFRMSIFVIALIFSFFSISIAGWQSDVAQNETRALWYINELRISPKNLVRPKLIPSQGWQGQRANREMEAAMDRAERLALSGRGDLIEVPVFQHTRFDRRR